MSGVKLSDLDGRSTLWISAKAHDDGSVGFQIRTTKGVAWTQRLSRVDASLLAGELVDAVRLTKPIVGSKP